jgi:hypothetical protein
MTIDELLAREEIKALRSAYSAHFDAHEVDALAALFTEDAVCEFGPYGEWHGRDTIRANYAQVIGAIAAPFDTLHVATNPHLRITSPTTAIGRWYLIDLVARQQPGIFESRGGHDHPLIYLGMYEDDYRKVDGRWLIAHVRLHFLWPEKAYKGLRHPSGSES